MTRIEKHLMKQVLWFSLPWITGKLILASLSIEPFLDEQSHWIIYVWALTKYHSSISLSKDVEDDSYHFQKQLFSTAVALDTYIKIEEQQTFMSYTNKTQFFLKKQQQQKVNRLVIVSQFPFKQLLYII